MVSGTCVCAFVMPLYGARPESGPGGCCRSTHDRCILRWWVGPGSTLGPWLLRIISMARWGAPTVSTDWWWLLMLVACCSHHPSTSKDTYSQVDWYISMIFSLLWCCWAPRFGPWLDPSWLFTGVNRSELPSVAEGRESWSPKSCVRLRQPPAKYQDVDWCDPNIIWISMNQYIHILYIHCIYIVFIWWAIGSPKSTVQTCSNLTSYSEHDHKMGGLPFISHVDILLFAVPPILRQSR